MSHPTGVESTLPGLPAEIRYNILEKCTNIHQNRVERRFWRELETAELNSMVDRYWGSRHSDNEYMLNVDCQLSSALILSSKEHYHEGRKLVQKMKFVQIDGWAYYELKTLFEYGTIPMWSDQPSLHEHPQFTQDLPPGPHEIVPIMTLSKSPLTGRTFFISMEDLSFLCKVIYVSRIQYRHSAKSSSLSLHFTVPQEGITPAFWGLETDEEVKAFLHSGIIRYIRPWITQAFLGSELASPIGDIDATVSSQPLSRRMNHLEAWIVENAQRPPALQLDIEVDRLIWMFDNALSKVSQAEELVTMEDRYVDAINLYIEAKDLFRHVRAQWRNAPNLRDYRYMLTTYDLCCIRLMLMTDHITAENRFGTRKAVTQWAYINCVELMRNSHKLKTRSRILLRKAQLQVDMSVFPDQTIASNLGASIYAMLKRRNPKWSHGELLEAIDDFYKTGGASPPPKEWEVGCSHGGGCLEPVDEAASDSIVQRQPRVSKEEWLYKFELVKELIRGPPTAAPKLADHD
ncbi:hypothetical protein LTR84_009013 [Exophiala bonariae]|uniref:F-box domain-containing protein n=1 Tax=Exophiala bonariae TaxID=1690606 RepID=A0AAV9MVE5_9EURO|nr:hypothetical protein LTR84_009013 [Exophiala bonariae]